MAGDQINLNIGTLLNTNIIQQILYIPTCLQGWIYEFFDGGGVGGSGQEFFKGVFRVQVRGNFHILTSKKINK